MKNNPTAPSGHVGSSDLFGDFARLLGELGFQLSRGTYHAANGDTLPTVVITRPDTPEWSGVWDRADDGEDQAILHLCGNAFEKWNADALFFSPNIAIQQRAKNGGK